MFIVWGRKAVYRKVGWVADFCPMCRRAQVFQVRRVGMASHVYYIPFGQGTLVGHQRTCRGCGTGYEADLGRYRRVSRERGSLAEVLDETFPLLRETHAGRLGVEARLYRGTEPIHPDDRKFLLREPFELLADRVEALYGSRPVDWPSLAALAFALVLAAIEPWLIVPGLLLFVAVIYGSSTRVLRRKVAAQLAATLRPLHPTTEELSQVLAEFAQGGRRIGAKLRVRDLQQHLEKAPPAEAAALA